MSHFRVLVIGEDVEKQLEPYQENNMGNCPSKYLEFIDVEEKYRKEYENGFRHEFYCESRSSWGAPIKNEMYLKLNTCTNDEIITLVISNTNNPTSYFKLNKKYSCYSEEEKENPKNKKIWIEVVEIVRSDHPNENVCFSGIVKVKKINPPKETPLKAFYSDFDTFIEHWAGYEKNENGKYGYYENPNAKWDWYKIGGRWEKMLLHKNGSKVNSLKVKELDFNNMKRENHKAALKDWDFFLSFYPDGKVKLPKRSWKSILSDDKIKNKQAFYWDQPEMKEWNIFKNAKDAFILDINVYDCSKEKFIEIAEKACLETYAVITKDGKWNSPGSMGWFGFSSESFDESIKWKTEFYNRFIENLDKNETITIVDCHI